MKPFKVKFIGKNESDAYYGHKEIIFLEKNPYRKRRTNPGDVTACEHPGIFELEFMDHEYSVIADGEFTVVFDDDWLNESHNYEFVEWV